MVTKYTSSRLSLAGGVRSGVYLKEEVWQQEIFESLFSVTNEGGCLVTYCAKGEVRRRMEGAGFQVERLPGSAGKREMLRAIRNKS